MTKEEKNLLLALCLGDGNLAKPFKKMNGSAGSSFLNLVHSPAQLGYLTWKRDLIHKILGIKANIREHWTINPANNQRIPIFRLAVGHRYFAILRKYLYQNNRKIFTPALIHRLSPLGLAIWYLDDGCLYT